MALPGRWIGRLASLVKEPDPHGASSREFWEAPVTEDDEDHFWAAQPLVRRAINRRITGDPTVWPMEWFARRFARAPFTLGLSAGCGEGGLERDLLGKNVCRSIDAFDFSREALGRARRAAEETGVADRVRYREGNLDALTLPAEAYDIAFFHGSLHHARELEAALATVARALKPGGLIYVDEYTGPARWEWSDSVWRFARAAFEAMPECLKNRPELAVPLPFDDPSESIRSSEIPDAIRARFEILEDRPYGGNILWFTFPCLDMRALKADRSGALTRLIALEDHLLENRWVESYFRLIVARRS